MLNFNELSQFNRDGYTVLDSIIPNDVLEDIQRAARQMSNTEPLRSSWNERSCFRREAFCRLLDAPELIELAVQLIGEDVQLLQFDMLRTRSGDAEPEWHRDVEFAAGKTLAVSIAIYLQDTPAGAGPLRLVPGSHRQDDGPPRSLGDLEGGIAVPVPAGAAVVHDAALWHAGTIDGPSVDCWALFPIFGKFWIKRRDLGCTQPPPARILGLTDPLKRQLLGFALRPGVQSYLGDLDQYNRRGDPGLDFTQHS
ncbi:MAG: phytanoyl-CoA dioxygenase family protein [Rhizobium sp.]|nr:phytanoyl-CoA dioxygenase family protein [Rhizobium sp.]